MTTADYWAEINSARQRKSMANGDLGIQVVCRTRSAPCSQSQRSHQAIGEWELVQSAKEILEGVFERMGISSGHARNSSVQVGEMSELVPRPKGCCTRVWQWNQLMRPDGQTGWRRSADGAQSLRAGWKAATLLLAWRATWQDQRMELVVPTCAPTRGVHYRPFPLVEWLLSSCRMPL